MDIKQLNYFIRVAELGSVTYAAATLGISQPVLSRQVRRLEVELGKHLLYRNGRGVTLTDTGKRLLAHGRDILHQLQLARQELDNEHAEPVGKVVVGLPPSVCKQFAVPLVERFRSRYARASLGIVEGLTVSMQEWLMLGRLDFALLYDPAPTAQLVYENLWSEELCLVSPRTRKDKPRASLPMKALGRYPLILPSRPHAVRTLVEAETSRQAITLDIALEVDAIPSVLDLVEKGYGHAILSRTAVESWAKSAVLTATPLVRPGILTRLVIATFKERRLTGLAQRTIDLIKSDIVPHRRKSGGAAQ